MEPPGDEENGDVPAAEAVFEIYEEEPADDRPVTISRSLTEDAAVPDAPLPIRVADEHRRRFQMLAFKYVAALVAFVTLATLGISAIAPEVGGLAVEISKTSLPALFTLLGTAVAWAFRSDQG
jgi:predicted anti-sigma-YlaC factor YlaD